MRLPCLNVAKAVTAKNFLASANLEDPSFPLINVGLDIVNNSGLDSNYKVTARWGESGTPLTYNYIGSFVSLMQDFVLPEQGEETTNPGFIVPGQSYDIEVDIIDCDTAPLIA